MFGTPPPPRAAYVYRVTVASDADDDDIAMPAEFAHQLRAEKPVRRGLGEMKASDSNRTPPKAGKRIAKKQNLALTRGAANHNKHGANPNKHANRACCVSAI